MTDVTTGALRLTRRRISPERPAVWNVISLNTISVVRRPVTDISTSCKPIENWSKHISASTTTAAAVIPLLRSMLNTKALTRHFPDTVRPTPLPGHSSTNIALPRRKRSPTGGFASDNRLEEASRGKTNVVSRPIGPLRRVWGHIDISGPSSLVALANDWHSSYRRCPRRQRGESSYPFEDRSVQPTRDSHLRHLEGDVLGMPNHFGPDLDQLFPQGRHRPGLHGTWQNQSA